MPLLKTIPFGPLTLPSSQIFLSTQYTLGIVNISPIVSGHVLLIPKRPVLRVANLTKTECDDLFWTARNVAAKNENTTWAIQEGKVAGQSIEHVHVHIIPRKEGDFERNDDIYTEIDQQHKELKREHIEDENRKRRTAEEMHEEALRLRKLYDHFDEYAS